MLITRIWRSASVVAAVGFCLVGSTSEAADPKVPPGFTIEKVAGYPLVERPIFASFDDDGALYVGESSGDNLKRDDQLAKRPHWISKLTDTDGDGVFDKSVRFVEGITLPQGALWYQGSLYVTCPPGIWKFTDTDGDGKADLQEELLTGFGFSGNACDTHGPFLSPNGRLYIVQGRHGHEFKDKNGVVYSKGKAGRIYSMTPEGQDVRVHAGGGFDNPVEVDFTESGEIIGTVNILYRDRGDCLIHWVEGGVYPREDQADSVAEFKWTGGLMGHVFDLGHTAVSGITRYRGDQLGAEFRDRWFFTEFNTHKMRYAQLKPTGATFTSEVHEFLQCDDGDFHPTDVLEDADGSLLVLNTGGWFLIGCPTSRVAKPEIYGGVYRVRKSDHAKIADARGKSLPKLTSDMFGFEQVLRLLDDPRPVVREQTIQTLRFRPEFQKLIRERLQLTGTPSPNVVNDGLSTRVFIGLVRALSLNDQSASELASGLIGRLTDIDLLPEEQVAEARIRSLAILHFLRDLTWNSRLTEAASKRLLDVVDLSSPDVFLAGMELAATLCTDRVTPVVQVSDADWQQFIEKSQGQLKDPVSAHALTYALIRQRPVNALQVALGSTNPAVQRVALIALDQVSLSPLTQQMVLPLLSTKDPVLQRTALEVITRHSGWGDETLVLLKNWVSEATLSADREHALRGFLVAQIGTPSVQAFAVDVLKNEKTIDPVRLLLWETLQKAVIAKWPETLNPLLVNALTSENELIQLAALKIISQRAIAGFDAPLLQISQSDARSWSIRSEAIAALGATGKGIDDGNFQPILAALRSEAVSSDEKALIGRALGSSNLSTAQLSALALGLDKAGPLVVPALLKAYAKSSDETVGQGLVAALLASDSSASVSPDELLGVLRRYPESVKQAAVPLFKKLGIDAAAQEARLVELSPLMEGGDAVAGRAVFFGQKAACGSCHAVGTLGGRIGPHLTTIGASRTAKDLLEAIVYPSASFVNGYRTTLVVTVDGKVIQGVISSETTDTITLRTQDLQEVRISREDIDEQRESSTSIMPAGLDRQLTPTELRDLLAYLQSRK
ncbi:PVC-type heme-binding CxxCH protein [Planctomicrobium sp. SH527]|uniref:PVC-type heme-binding CxxCH protein n=1 Tax=Planctomicrobium sp. SH527 TaxID=3448123 RepID=UPI003F5C5ED3